MKKILVAGESWTSFQTHIKGVDAFFNSNYETGATYLIKSLNNNGFNVNYIPNHKASKCFPNKMDKLNEYDAVILSDIGSNTLLLHPDTLIDALRTPNRLKLLKKYVEIEGGALLMIGGYLTFQGIEAKGQWQGTPVEEILPVDLKTSDDRVEVPEGFTPQIIQHDHPIFANINSEWPWFLGYNKFKAKKEENVLLRYKEDPILAVNTYGEGKTAAFASDCAPHWGSKAFIEWEYYERFWVNLVNWLINS